DLRRGRAQLYMARVVNRVMRSASRLWLSLLFASTACARPVLYYPEPLTAAAKPADSKAAPRPSASPSSGVPLMTAGEYRPAGSTSASADVEYLRGRQIVVPVAGADM